MEKREILAVDDPILMRQVFGLILGDEFSVDLAGDGSEALEKIESSGMIYDLVITDLYMPIMDGIELIKRLRALREYECVPIMVVSTESDEGKRNEARCAGASGWIVKPIDETNLLNAAMTLAHWSHI